MFENRGSLYKKVMNYDVGDLAVASKAKYVRELVKEGFALNHLLHVTDLPHSTYYYYTNKKEHTCDQWLKDEIVEIFNEHRGRYGYRRITLELRNRGFVVNHKRVYRIMKQLNLKATQQYKKCYSSYKGKVGIVTENLIERNFYADAPFRKCYTDVTELRVKGSKKKVYLSVVLDGYNSEILSYTLSYRPSVKQIIETVVAAFPDKDYKQMILHSDKGWYYQHGRYHRILQQKNIVSSMSSDGRASDNAMCESFFSILKREIRTEESQKVDLFRMIPAYILYYNRYRIKQHLSGQSPLGFKQLKQNEKEYL